MATHSLNLVTKSFKLLQSAALKKYFQAYINKKIERFWSKNSMYWTYWMLSSSAADIVPNFMNYGMLIRILLILILMLILVVVHINGEHFTYHDRLAHLVIEIYTFLECSADCYCQCNSWDQWTVKIATKYTMWYIFDDELLRILGTDNESVEKRFIVTWPPRTYIRISITLNWSQSIVIL